jgi:hypothetical protein
MVKWKEVKKKTKTGNRNKIVEKIYFQLRSS